ncbi:hypothetical protein [Pseudoalteromonas denitrificans]|uniref:Uncharacterized protein n=1 Tax=Pseudoalteromonas denitrificans DSM 6059 TaxID=1123010 RepID=A0A1I1SAQ4_9GAMM|nr:hypothetical protein [Pseudoalteromonas denitrificans]SFD43526.1 hypothetical protein SAMN02745724_04516 [Pseudoalteromonas denitrificans DSM 6059]
MGNQTISSVITNFGISDELQGIFYALREMPSLHCLEQMKFKKHEIDSLAQSIVCRNYGKLCLELSYFCFAIVNYSKEIEGKRPLVKRFPSLLSYFWQNEYLSANQTKSFFQKSQISENYKISLIDNAINLKFSKSQFDISISRVGLLASFIEFLVYVEPKILIDLERDLLDCDVNQIKSISSELQKNIYQFLTLHLSSAQIQRRFRYIANYLDEVISKQAVSEQALWLTDEFILNFWLDSSDEGSNLGFKLFTSCFYELVDFQQAIKVAQLKINARTAQSIGANVEAGEISADLLELNLMQLQSQKLEIDWLCLKPKFLTKNQISDLKPFISTLPTSKTLSLTLARVCIFGTWQASIVQSARKNNVELIKQKLNTLPEDGYEVFIRVNENLLKQVFDTLWTLLHINHQHQQGQMFSLFNQLVEDKKLLKDLQCLLATEVKQNNLNDIQSVFKALPQWQLILPELNKTLNYATKVFNANNKSGFNQLPLLQDLEIYHEGQDLLLLLKKELSRFMSNLNVLVLNKNKQGNTKEENFSSDVSIFFNKFNSLYGVGNGS